MLDNQFVHKSSSAANGQASDLPGDFVGTQTPIYTTVQAAILDFEQESAHESAVDEVSVPVSPRIAKLQQNAVILMQNREFNLAMNLLRQASNEDSRDVKTLKLLDSCLSKLGRDSEAMIVKKNLAKINYTYSSINSYANALYKSGLDQAALENYFEALSVLSTETSELFETYKNMGNIFVKQSDFEAAEEYYNKAYTMNSSSDVLLVNLGTLEVQRNDFDKSLYCFRKAVSVNPENDKAWVGLAMVHNHFGDRELAWANIDSALDVNPANRTAVLLASNWGMRDSQVGKSIEILQNYLATVEENDEEMSLVLINLFCTAGHLDLALIEMDRVLLWNPKNQEVRNLKKTILSARKGS